MKIGEVTIGTEYGATAGRRRTYSGDLPRRVTALAVEQVEVTYWQGGGWSPNRGTKNVRQVRVRCEDEPLKAKSSWADDNALTAPKGTELVLEARFLVSPWSELRADVAARLKAKQETADAEAEYERRIRALLPKKMHDDWFYVDANSAGRKTSMQAKYGAPGIYVDVKLGGRALDHILDMAEQHLIDAGLR